MSPEHIVKVIAHGVVGGASSALNGGEFKDGFLAAGFTQLAAPGVGTFRTREVRVVVAAVIGGTASKIGGGRFANGAVTGAFSRLFNDDFYPDKPPGDFVQVRDPQTGKLMWVHRDFSNDILMQTGRPSPSVTISREQAADFLSETSRLSAAASGLSVLAAQPVGVVGFGAISAFSAGGEQLLRPDIGAAARNGLIDISTQNLPPQVGVPSNILLHELDRNLNQ